MKRAGIIPVRGQQLLAQHLGLREIPLLEQGYSTLQCLCGSQRNRPRVIGHDTIVSACDADVTGCLQSIAWAQSQQNVINAVLDSTVPRPSATYDDNETKEPVRHSAPTESAVPRLRRPSRC